jgi:hypothetical protein
MKKGWKIFKWVLFGIVVISIFGWVTMLLWNWLVPDLFNGNVINFWQSLGLLMLIKILFWGVGGRYHCHRHPGAPWKNRFYEKLSKMSPEDREAFKNKMKEKWCTPQKSAGTETSAND